MCSFIVTIKTVSEMHDGCRRGNFWMIIDHVTSHSPRTQRYSFRVCQGLPGCHFNSLTDKCEGRAGKRGCVTIGGGGGDREWGRSLAIPHFTRVISQVS